MREKIKMETQEIKKRGRKKIIKPIEDEEEKEEIIIEPKKRGRQKKVSNELIQQIQDMKIEDFHIEEEEITMGVKEMKNNIEEITKGVESIVIEEEETQERNERREIEKNSKSYWRTERKNVLPLSL